MKNSIIFLIAFTLTSNVFAQSNKEDIDLIQSMFGKEKKELVSVYMTIPDDQKDKFWSMYDTYENARKKLGRERIDIFEGYAKNYGSLDDKKATELTKKKLAWTDKYTTFQQLYFNKFSGIIGGVEAAKFIQLEDYIENTIRIGIQRQIPFIGELDKTALPGHTHK